MRFDYLREFVLLSQYRKFGTTASKLYMTQSVLSRHISALEGELGIQLLQRNTQSVTLTEAGSYFLRGVTRILEEYDTLVRETALKEQLYDHTLRLGINYYAFNYYLGNIPQHFQLHYPRTKVSYRTGSPDQLIKAVLSDEVDAILVNHFAFRHSSQLEFMDLFQEPYCVLLPDYHPLASRDAITLGDLRQESFVGVDTSVFSCSWEYLCTLFQREGFPPRRPVMYPQLEEATVAIRQGIGLLIEGQILRRLTSTFLVCRPLVGEGCRRPVSVAYKKGNTALVISQLLDSYAQQLACGWVPSI